VDWLPGDQSMMVRPGTIMETTTIDATQFDKECTGQQG
jgi:hypothetical protein